MAKKTVLEPLVSPKLISRKNPEISTLCFEVHTIFFYTQFFLGTKRTIPEGKYAKIAQQIKLQKLDGLLIIGGFEAYQTCLQLSEQRINFKEFCIPICIIPATISNNVPGSEFSLGADTALNEISEICDRIRQSVS